MKKRHQLRLTQDEVEQFEALYKNLQKKEILGFRRRQILQQFENVKNCKNIRALRYFLILVFDRDPELSKVAENQLEEMMKEYDYRDYLDVNQIFRYVWGCCSFDYLVSRLQMKQVIEYIQKDYVSPYVLALLTFHANGHIREKSLECMEKNSKLTLICSILRLNDWVDGIRDKALKQTVCAIRCNDNYIEMMPLLDRVNRWSRADLKTITNAIDHSIKGIISSEKIIKLYYQTKDISLKRSLYRKMLEHSYDMEEVILHGLKSKDMLILNMLILYLTEHHQVSKYLNFLYAHRLPKARVFALTQMYDRKHKMLEQHLLQSMFDVSYNVRDLARFYLRTMNCTEVVHIYHQALNKGQHIKIALKSLSELNDVKSYDRIADYIYDERYQKTVLVCLASLDFDRSKDFLLTSLFSDDPQMSRTARKVLKNHMLHYKELLEKRLFSTLYDHVKYNILLLSNALIKWESLSFLLYVYGQNIRVDPEVLNNQLMRCLAKFRHVYTLPSDELKEEIEMRYQTAKDAIRPEFVNEIKHIIMHNLGADDV